MKIFHKYLWTDSYYDFKWSVWALFKYFKIVIQTRPWDYNYVLMMMHHQVKLLKKCIENGNECDETRIPKVQKMNTFLELLDGVIKDEYYERSKKTIEKTRKLLIEKYEEDKSAMEIDEKKRTEMYLTANKIEEKEWNDMIKIFKDNLKGWWD